MSETISAWSWPTIETIDAVSATLRDRIKRLNIDIANIEQNAKIYATSAEDLAEYRREAKSLTTYTVLIEQVKSQSLAAGFQPETFKVFEYATPPLASSFPKRNHISFGRSTWFVPRCALALVNSMLRNVYYTRSALLSNAGADLALKSKPIRRLAQKPIADIIALLSKQQVTLINEADLNLQAKILFT